MYAKSVNKYSGYQAETMCRQTNTDYVREARTHSGTMRDLMIKNKHS